MRPLVPEAVDHLTAKPCERAVKGWSVSNLVEFLFLHASDATFMARSERLSFPAKDVNNVVVLLPLLLLLLPRLLLLGCCSHPRLCRACLCRKVQALRLLIAPSKRRLGYEFSMYAFHCCLD